MNYKFPKIWTLGMKYTENIFDHPVEITEKLDGSQFIFGKKDGKVFCHSKGAVIPVDDPHSWQKLFVPAITHVLSVEHLLPDNFVFFSETLCNKRHNTLTYERVPKNHIALFGASDLSYGEFASYGDLVTWAEVLGVDAVPLLANGDMSKDAVLGLMNKPSAYGGSLAEGVVIKAYVPNEQFGNYYGVLSAKVVTEAFKEKHSKNPEFTSGKSKTADLFASYNTEARFLKTVQALRDSGELEVSPRDIGKLLKHLNTDLEEECKEEVKDALYSIYRKEFLSIASRGFPQWYKDKLMENVL